VQAFFLPVGDGHRFCLFHPSRLGTTSGAVIYLHPFAEEMNKSRRMAALQARAMSEAGYAVLQIDLLGCGDSSGDFGDATWAIWCNDVLAAHQWLRLQTNAPLILWGLRAGCLLAANAAVNLPEGTNFIFWQPVVSGRQHWQQFIRLKMAGEIASGQSKGVTEQLRQQVAAGKNVEIAGYSVSAKLAEGLEQAELHPPEHRPWLMAWFEVSLREEATIAPIALKHIEHWQLAGFDVTAKVIHGPGFWQTTEIEDAPDLIVATLSALEAMQ
jgi:uncharacterized protein